MQLEKSFFSFFLSLCCSQTHLFPALHKYFSQSCLQQDNPILSCGELKTQDLFHRIFLHPVLLLLLKFLPETQFLYLHWLNVSLLISTHHSIPSFTWKCKEVTFLAHSLICIEGKRVRIVAYYFSNTDVLESEASVPTVTHCRKASHQYCSHQSFY